MLVVSLLGAASCETGGERIRVGAAAVYRATSVGVQREFVDEVETSLDDASAVDGLYEVVSEGEDAALMLRGTVARSQHEVRGAIDDASVTQGFVFGLYARRFRLSDWLELRPMVGVGVGYVHVDLDPLLGYRTTEGLAAALAGGVELQLVDHVILGAMGYGAVFGFPGDTEGDLGSGMLYLGLRF